MLHLIDIEIRNFRRLHAPVRIAGLEPGLNLIAGDNEEGKSTVLAALRAVLFERHNLTGAAAARMQPFGSTVRPEIGVTFRIGDDHYALAKGFCQRPSAELTTPGGSFSGAAAEEELRRILDFEGATRGESKAAERGVLGMLIVEQGTTHHGLTMHEHGQRTLRSALEEQVGDVLGGGEGDALLERIRVARDGYFTPTGRPTREYKEARDTVSRVRDELAEVERDLADFEHAVERLQRLESERESHRSDNTLARLKAQLDAAESRQRERDAMAAAVERAQHTLALAEADLREIDRRCEERREDRTTLSTLQTRLSAVADVAHNSEAELQLAGKELGRLESERSEARQWLRRAELTHETDTLTRERDESARREKELNDRLKQAHEAQERRRQAQRARAAIRVDDDTVKRLRDAHNRLDALNARLQAGATRVDLDLAVALTRDGEPAESRGSLTLTQTTRLEIADVGTLTVHPGGHDIESITAERDALKATVEQISEHAGVDTLSAAENALREAARLQAGIDHEKTRLDLLAPAGTDALETEMATVSQRRVELDARLESLAADLTATADDERESAPSLLDARARITAVEEQLEAQRRHIQTLQAEAATRNAERARIAEDIDRLESRLASARATLDDDALARQREQAAQQCRERTADVDAMRNRLAAADPEAVDTDLSTARTALERYGEQAQTLERDIESLRGELRGRGQPGLGERREELRALLADAEKRERAIDLQARAVDLLCSVVEDAAREARDTLLRPIMERVAPLLRRLMPDTELQFDETMALVGIRRGGVEEPFGELSIGTREQLAVIVRLAFAEVLASHGHPVLVVLDDALVYADSERFDRMQSIIARCAQQFQILLLTCRERDYITLGAPRWRLSDCRIE